MKYILVTGGVISGIGKGVISSSIGALLKGCGLHVTSIKIDPYLNIDAGTFSPYEHGKVLFFVHLLSNERLIAPVTSFAREVHGSNVSRHFYSSSLVHQLGIRREFTRCLWQENFDALRNLVLAALRKKKIPKCNMRRKL